MDQPFIVGEEARASIRAHSEASYPNECVGLLLGRIDGARRVCLAAFPVENRWAGQVALAGHDDAASQRERFYLDPRDYLRAERAAAAQGLEVLGCYHSHPDWPAEPSPRDLVGAQGVGGGSSFAFLIQSVHSGQAAELRSWLLHSTGDHFIEEAIELE